MRLHGSSIYSSIALNENKFVPKEVQILRVGKFKHPTYGDFEITNATLAEMKANFDLNIRGVDMAFDYFHDSDKEASAWVKALELRENGTELWALVDWTPKAEQKLSERELRYFSPDFAFNWTDPEAGVTFNNVLFGGGLTNRPFVKEMKAIVANETKGVLNMNELEKVQKENADLKAANLKLSEDMKAQEKKMADMVPPAPAADAKEEGDEVANLKKQIADLQAQLAKAQGDMQVMAGEKAKVKEEKMLAEKETAFNVLLTEGKACVAQKAAFIKGDMNEFVKLAQPLNLKASGSSNSATPGDDDVKAILKLAEEKQKSNPKLNRGDAISLAKRELKN